MTGTSGLSKVLVQVETATWMEEESATGAEMRTYVKLAFLTSTGTKDDAKDSAAAMRMIVMMKPRTAWVSITV